MCAYKIKHIPFTFRTINLHTDPSVLNIKASNNNYKTISFNTVHLYTFSKNLSESNTKSCKRIIVYNQLEVRIKNSKQNFLNIVVLFVNYKITVEASKSS